MQSCAWQCHSFAACTTDHHCSPCHFSCLCSSSMCLTLRHTSVTSNETAVQSLCRKNDNNEAQRVRNEAFFLPKWVPIGTRLKKVNPQLTHVLLGIQMGNEFKKPLRGFRHTGIWGHPFWFFWLIHVELSQQRPSWTQTNSDRRQRNLQALPLSWTKSDRRQRNLQVLPLSLTCVFC